MYASATGLEAQTSSGNSTQIRHWAREPRIGEASNPGPHAYFDNESDDAWSEFGDQRQSEQEYEEAMPPTEYEVTMSAESGTQSGSSTYPTPVLSATQEWIKKHANKSFVPVLSKRVTKASKFDGAKPGWVFKTGDSGLGYYRDSGSQRTQLSLDLALRPMRTVPAPIIILNDLVLADVQGQNQGARGPIVPGPDPGPPYPGNN